MFDDDVSSVASFDAFSCSLLVSFVAAFKEFESASEGGTIGSLSDVSSIGATVSSFTEEWLESTFVSKSGSGADARLGGE